MIIEHSFELNGSGGQPIRGDLRLDAAIIKSSGVVVFCHGLKGFKDWGGWPDVMRALARAGFIAISFNFSHGGIGKAGVPSDGPCSQSLSFSDTFSELELFKLNTYAREREDLECVLDAIASGALDDLSEGRFSRVTFLPIFLIGHSRGGACVICVGARRPDVSAVVTLASVSSLGRVPPGLEDKWRRDGVRYIENSRTKQQLPLGIDLLDEILRDRQIVENAARKLNKPLLVMHGVADEAVAVSAAEELASWAPEVELDILPKADHVFGMKHVAQSARQLGLTASGTGSELMDQVVIPRIIDFLRAHSGQTRFDEIAS